MISGPLQYIGIDARESQVMGKEVIIANCSTDSASQGARGARVVFYAPAAIAGRPGRGRQH